MTVPTALEFHQSRSSTYPFPLMLYIPNLQRILKFNLFGGWRHSLTCHFPMSQTEPKIVITKGTAPLPSRWATPEKQKNGDGSSSHATPSSVNTPASPTTPSTPTSRNNRRRKHNHRKPRNSENTQNELGTGPTPPSSGGDPIKLENYQSFDWAEEA